MAKDKRAKREERNYTSGKDRVEKRGSGFENTSLNIPEGVKFFSMKKAGTYRLDVIPYVVGEGNPYADPGHVHFERTYFIHRSVGANSDSYVCLQKTFKKPCPICEYVAKSRRDPKSDPDVIKEMEPKERQLWRVIDLAEPDEGIKLWDVSFHLFGKMLDAKIRHSDEDDHYDEFFRLDRGMTLKIGAEEESFQGNSFCKVTDIEFKQRKTPLEDSLIDEAPNLDQVPKEVPYKELKKIFLQIEDTKPKDEDEEGAEDEAEEEEEKPKPKPKVDPKKPKPKPKPVEPEEDEDDDDGDSETDDDDDEGGDDAEDESEDDDGGGDEDEDEGEPEDEEEGEGDEEEDAEEPEEDEGEAPTFAVGDAVFHDEHGECKVVHVSGDGSSIRIKDKEGEVHRAIDPDDLTKRAAKKPAGKKPVSDPFEDEDDDEPKPPVKKPVGKKPKK